MTKIFHLSVPNTTETTETGSISLEARSLADTTIMEVRLNALKSIYSTVLRSSNVAQVTENRTQQLLGPIVPLTTEQRKLFQNELTIFAKNHINLIQDAHEQDMKRK